MTEHTAISEKILESLPLRYRVCPHVATYQIPGFSRYRDGIGFSFCPEPVEMDDWYWSFVSRVRGAMGRSFLPICRLADGEFRMLFWPVLPNPRHSAAQRVKDALVTVIEAAEMAVRGFRANTLPHVSSGQFSAREWSSIRRRASDAFQHVGREGILAMHLGVAKQPFQEQYFPSIRRWLAEGGLELSLQNYVPFYFVYALLRGPAGDFIFEGRRVVVVHSAEGDRQRKITEAIKRRGAETVNWIHISRARSFADRLDVSELVGRCDVCLVGAGVGKAIVMEQLRPLAVPVIDAGFVFEAWADERRALTRPFMIPDERQ